MTKEKLKEIEAKALKEIAEEKLKKRKIIRLHYLPNAIKQSIKELKDASEQGELKNLFEDIEVLVAWALDRLPLVAPNEGAGKPTPSRTKSTKVKKSVQS